MLQDSLLAIYQARKRGWEKQGKKATSTPRGTGPDEAMRLTAKTAVGAANCGYFSRVLRGALWGSWRVSAGLSWGRTGGGGRTRILWDRGQPALRVWRGAPGPFYLRNHFSWIIGLDRNSSRPVTPSLVPGLTVR